jgi:hypothetical protein
MAWRFYDSAAWFACKSAAKWRLDEQEGGVMSRTVVSWVAAALLAATTTFVFAQNRSSQPQVLSGADVGFRIEGSDFRGRPTGTLVVRIDGNWVQVGSSTGVHPATK